MYNVPIMLSMDKDDEEEESESEPFSSSSLLSTSLMTEEKNMH